MEAFLQERGLELSPEKTRLTPIEEGFDFLGQNGCKYNGTLLIKPSKKSVAALLGKVREVVRVNRANAAGVLILQLNPIIRGWAGYHRHVASKETFARVDHQIFQMVWRWARRRHPNKNLRWIKDKYFGLYGGDHWRLFGQVERGGAVKTLYLYKASSVPIERHVKIQMHANPYDPQWELYFEKRLGVKMKGDLRQGRPAASEAVAVPLDTTARNLPCLRPEAHQPHQVAQPPPGLADSGRLRQSREPRSAPSQLPSSSP